jgi:hypothetical protein
MIWRVPTLPKAICPCQPPKSLGYLQWTAHNSENARYLVQNVISVEKKGLAQGLTISKARLAFNMVDVRDYFVIGAFCLVCPIIFINPNNFWCIYDQNQSKTGILIVSNWFGMNDNCASNHHSDFIYLYRLVFNYWILIAEIPNNCAFY